MIRSGPMGTPFQIGTTPNPNSIRIGLAQSMFPKPATYKSAQEAEGQPIAKALFGIPGIAQVFTLNNFITITKDPSADWGKIEPKVAEVLMAQLNG